MKPPTSVAIESTASRAPSLGNGVTRHITPQEFESWLRTLSTSTPLEAHAEFLTDWMGVRTRVDMLPWAPSDLAGTVTSHLPVPDDGYRSEDFEYVALARALAQTSGPFEMVEIGAGWAPWSVAALVACRERGRPARAIAVEADPRRVAWAMQHAGDNGIAATSVTGEPTEVETSILEWGQSEETPLLIVGAAAWHCSTWLDFPLLPIDDMGGAVWTLPGTDVDYRGAHAEHRQVPAIAISALLRGMRKDCVDLLHVDVQGIEFDLLRESAREIQERVALMAIGTHCRLNEGQLLDFFLRRGWGVILESPCRSEFTMTRPTLAGFTVQDGLQLWENPFLRD